MMCYFRFRFPFWWAAPWHSTYTAPLLSATNLSHLADTFNSSAIIWQDFRSFWHAGEAGGTVAMETNNGDIMHRTRPLPPVNMALMKITSSYVSGPGIGQICREPAWHFNHSIGIRWDIIGAEAQRHINTVVIDHCQLQPLDGTKSVL